MISDVPPEFISEVLGIGDNGDAPGWITGKEPKRTNGCYSRRFPLLGWKVDYESINFTGLNLGQVLIDEVQSFGLDGGRLNCSSEVSGCLPFVRCGLEHACGCFRPIDGHNNTSLGRLLGFRARRNFLGRNLLCPWKSVSY